MSPQTAPQTPASGSAAAGQAKSGTAKPDAAGTPSAAPSAGAAPPAGAQSGAQSAGQGPSQAPGQGPGGAAGQPAADPAPGAQDKTRQALQGQAARQTASAGQQTVAPGPAGSNAAKVGQAAQPVPPAHPRKADLDADRSALKAVNGLRDYQSLITSLRVVATDESKASVNLRVNKLFDALTRGRAHLRAAYGAAAEPKIASFYDDRLKGIEAGLTARYMPKAQDAAGKIEKSGTVEKKDQWDATWELFDYKYMDPEEQVTGEVLDTTRGVMKVFDIGDLFKKDMAPDLKKAWTDNWGGEQAFVAECKAQGTLAVVPHREAGNPLYAKYTVATAFPNPIRGFVGLGRDAAAAQSFEEAIVRYALKREWYGSGVMLSSYATAGDVKAELPNLKLGKPSVFYLLRFDENTYEEKDRVFGHLADPVDPTKPGSALELQCMGLAQHFLVKNGRILS